jgi:hypothetical protein
LAPGQRGEDQKNDCDESHFSLLLRQRVRQRNRAGYRHPSASRVTRNPSRVTSLPAAC